MGLVAALRQAGGALAPTEADRECVGLPTLDPRLVLVYQPHRSQIVHPPEPHEVLTQAARRAVDRAVAAAAAAPEHPGGDAPGAEAPGPGCCCSIARAGQRGEALAPGGATPGAEAPGPGCCCSIARAGQRGEALAPGGATPTTEAPGPGCCCSIARAGQRGEALAPGGATPTTEAPGPGCCCSPGCAGMRSEALAPGGATPTTEAPGPGCCCSFARAGQRGEALAHGPDCCRAVGCPAVRGGAEGVGGAPPPLGLSEARSPQNGVLPNIPEDRQSRRHGRKGLTANGARQIRRAAAVLQDHQGMLAFWTVTLPDDTIRELVIQDMWPQFQSRIRDLLVRALEHRGMSARVVGVVELHPARSMRERLPLPHLHVVFQGSRQRWRGWVLRPEDLDGIIRAAVSYCGLPAPSVRSAGNVQPVRRNAGAYLAKYMAKSRQSDWLAAVPGNLPRVWWFWSARLRGEVLALVLPVSWGFAAWLHRASADELAALGVTRLRLELPDPRAPSTYMVTFSGALALRRAQIEWKDAEAQLWWACHAGLPWLH